MPTVLPDLLKLSRVTKVVSRIRTPGNVLSRFFGTQIGGKNVTQVPGSTYTYDLYDHVRKVASGKMRSAPAGAVAANPVGNVTVSLARSAEKLPMDYNKLLQIRRLGENAGVQDRMGAQYIERQGYTLKQRQENFREFILAGLLFNGGKYGFYQQGDSLLPTFNTSGTLFTVDHRIPVSNLLVGGSFAAGLQMGTGANIIDASWATAGTDIPAHLIKISAAFASLVGEPLATVWVSSELWLNILQNDKVRQLAGTSAKPFAEFTMTPDVGEDGKKTGLMRGTIVGLPWLTFNIYDGVLEFWSSPTTQVTTRLIDVNYALFSIEQDGQWFQMVEGSEIIKRNDVAEPEEVYGFNSWIQEKADPARFDLMTLQNVGIELNIPAGLAWARVK